jgi:tRNA U55 pseudouridine synthase TruB
MTITKTTTQTDITIDLTPDKEIEKGITSARKKIKSLKVSTAEECVAASKILADVAKLRRIAVKRYKERKAPVLDVSRRIDDNRNEALNAIAQLESTITTLIRAFRETEALARAAVEEAKRKQQEVEAAQRKEQQLASIRAAADSTPNESVKSLLEKQLAVLANAHTIIEPIEPEEAPQTLAQGVHERENAHAAIDDFEKLVLQVAAGMMAKFGPPPEVRTFLDLFRPNAQATLSCLQPAMPHLNKLAKNIGATDLALEGVRVEADSTFVAR